MSWLKRHLPKRRWKRVVLYFLSVLLILLAGDMALVQYWRHIDISYDTTRITSPLTSDGMPDYLAALNNQLGQGVTADNNAAPLLLEIFGTKDQPPKWRDAVETALGMPGGEHPSPMVRIGDVMRQRQAVTQAGTATPATQTSELPYQESEELQERLDKHIWRARDEPVGAAWIAANEDVLALLHQAVSRPRYWVPAVSALGQSGEAPPGELIRVLLPLVGSDRYLSDLTMARAMQRLGDRNVEGFEEDIIDVMKLARLTAQGGTLIEVLVAYAQETSAVEAVDRAATSGILTQTQSWELLRRVDALPPLPGLSNRIDTEERYFMLDEFVFAADQGLDKEEARWDQSMSLASNEPGFGSKLSAWLIPVHYNKILRRMNHYYDLTRDAAALPRYADRLQAVDVVENELNQRSALAKLTDVGGMLASIMVPSFKNVAKLHERMMMESDLAQISLELAIHKARSGEYPDTLAALVPAECSAVPLDGFVDKPLIYRREGAGYLLYSVGPDGHDDGGLPHDQAKNGNYDIVVRAEK